MKITAYVASAFSKNHEGGNKAGVVFMTQPLTRTQKMAIAKELGFAETAFISDSKIADFRLEYFTPKEEVDLCGHATIGAFTIMKHLNKLLQTEYTIETNSGLLAITANGEQLFMEQTVPTFYDTLTLEELSGCFDLNAVATAFPIQIVSTGLKDILVPIKNAQLLQDLQPNFEKIKLLSQKYGVIGMHLFALSEENIICRNFAPLYDIDEEAATGTSNGALACYLYHHQILQKTNYTFAQGYTLNAPSEVLVRLNTTSQKTIDQVLIGGRGYYVETKELFL